HLLQSKCPRTLDQAIDLEVPERSVHPRIDYVFGDTIKQVVRRDWLDARAFVLSAVITKSGGTVQPAHQSCASAHQNQAQAAQYESASPDSRSEFRIGGAVVRSR